jgi:hypothetical protein
MVTTDDTTRKLLHATEIPVIEGMPEYSNGRENNQRSFIFSCSWAWDKTKFNDRLFFGSSYD